jgi:hypothetical protein
MSGLNARARTVICFAEPGWNQPQRENTKNFLFFPSALFALFAAKSKYFPNCLNSDGVYDAGQSAWAGGSNWDHPTR